MFDSLQMRLAGQIAPAIADYVASRADSLVLGLLKASIEHWAAEDFHRWSDGEVSCTIRVYDWCDRLVNTQRAAYPMMYPLYEAYLPTNEMRLGNEDPARSPRPDMFIICGTAKIYIEAKRLSPSSPLPKEYVDEGMIRFASGRYTAALSRPGIMIGYIFEGSVQASYSAVNAIVRTHPQYGPSHEIRESDRMSAILPCATATMERISFGTSR